MEKPIYRSILMLKVDKFDNLYHKKRSKFGSLSQELEAHLYASSGLDMDAWKRKLMTVRALIFGVVVLYDSGAFEYNETTVSSQVK